MSKVITIGSALIDIFIHSSHFQLGTTEGTVMLCQRYGEKLEVDGFEVYTGGGATNTAVGFSRMGFEAAVIAETGRDAFAGVIEDELKKEKVRTELVIKEKKEQTGGSVILVGQDGGRTVMVHRGAASQLGLEDIPLDVLNQADWIHLSSISGHADVLKAIFATCAEHGVGLSWNPGRGELALLGTEVPISEITAKVLLLNAEEWESVSTWQSQLMQRIPEIVVTNGAQGGAYFAQGQWSTYQAQPVVSVDDTGAGDAFATGYVSARLLGHEPAEATTWGVKNGTSVVQHSGAKAGLLTRNQVQGTGY